MKLHYSVKFDIFHLNRVNCKMEFALWAHDINFFFPFGQKCGRNSSNNAPKSSLHWIYIVVSDSWEIRCNSVLFERVADECYISWKWLSFFLLSSPKLNWIFVIVNLFQLNVTYFEWAVMHIHVWNLLVFK